MAEDPPSLRARSLCALAVPSAHVLRLGAALLGVTLAAAAAAATPASASRNLQLGVFDDVEALQHPAATFAVLRKLHVRVVRMTLNWSDVAGERPSSPGDPGDRAYDWRPYDRAVQTAAR